MTKLAHAGAFTRFPDVLDFGDSTWAAMLPFWRQTFLIEDYVEEGRYVIRAEVAGLDADKNIDVSVQDRMLTIRTERHEEHREGRRSEFRYGSMSRTVELPSRAEKNKISATYDKGILQISVPLAEAQPTGHRSRSRQPGDPGRPLGVADPLTAGRSLIARPGKGGFH